MPFSEAVDRARACLGSPFRLHGRDPSIGLDCVGLIAIAWSRVEAAPTGYALRNRRDSQWKAVLDGLASRISSGEMGPGDALLLRAGPEQLHLGLWTGLGLIHADARIGHVIESPGRPAWPLIGCWRPSKGL
jgi:cell wall-associated NlpC family hydrolase